jgi:hypothetical protein
MTQTSLYTYAWDVSGTAGARALDRAIELGIRGITLATAYHAGRFVRPWAPDSKVVFPEDGTVYFRPRRPYGRIKPLVAAVTDEEDVLAALTKRGDLAVHGWTVLLHNTRLGYAHPDLTVRTAWGDHLYYSLCPAQAEVRDYAATLCADLAEQYALAGLVLETPGYMPFVHGYHHEFAQIPGNDWMNTLLGLCFCAACRAQAKAAGVPIDALRQRIGDGVEAYMTGPATVPGDMASEWLIADLVFDPDLVAFLRWRAGVVTRLVAEIREALPDHAKLAVIPSIQRPSAKAWGEGSDLRALAGICDWLEIPVYEPTAQRALADIRDCRRRTASDIELRAILRPGHPDIASREQLLEMISVLAAQGVRHFSFYNFGLLRPHNLDWLQAACAAIAALPASGGEHS